MDFLQSSQIGNVIHNYVNEDFILIALLTFFLCEAIFAAFPMEQARFKQLTSLIVGTLLGLFFFNTGSLTDALIRGFLSGGAMTIWVSKFKKGSFSLDALLENNPTTAVISNAPSVSVSTPATAPEPQPLAEPVEHL